MKVYLKQKHIKKKRKTWIGLIFLFIFSVLESSVSNLPQDGVIDQEKSASIARHKKAQGG